MLILFNLSLIAYQLYAFGRWQLTNDFENVKRKPSIPNQPGFPS